LGNAAGDPDENFAAASGCVLFETAHPSEFRVDFLRRFFPDVASVEDDEIGLVGRGGLGIAQRRQGVRHTL